MLVRTAVATLFLACIAPVAQAAANLDKISHTLVIYLENRSFDNLFGEFPGANGVFAPGRLRFQWHHQPFAAFENFDPATSVGRAARFIAEKHGLERLPQPRFDAVESLSRFF